MAPGGDTRLEYGVFTPLLFRIAGKEKQKRRKSAALQRNHLVRLNPWFWGTPTDTAMKAPGETKGDYPKIKPCGGTRNNLGAWPNAVSRLTEGADHTQNP